MKTIAIALIKLYRSVLSPWVPNACRFEPSCSLYMIEAIETCGLLRGIMRGSWRLLRCNPFGGFGYDPVSTQPTAMVKKQNV